jgi:aspartate/methionine/tyrosine aminotransferase
MHDELWERTFVVSSFGKTYHATGWKVGYCIAPPALTTEFRKVHQFTCFCVVTPIQHALADFMTAEARAPRGAVRLLPGETGSLLCAAEGLTLPSCGRPRARSSSYWITPQYRTKNDVDYARRLTRGDRRGLDPGIGVLRGALPRPQAALLLCKGRCNSRAGRGETMSALMRVHPY